jgi:hypothetical protein
MAELIVGGGASSTYREILELLLTKGKKQESRNGNTLEIEDLVIELYQPQYSLMSNARPGYNEAIGLVEGLQLVAGVSDSSLTCEIQPNFRAFMDDGEFWGAYGQRAKDQLPVIVDRLKADPDTRQAVVTLWDPKFDALGGKKDHPCTTAFNFRIREDDLGRQKLHMTTFMRSNDAYWGWPYDVYQFVLLQTTLANVLGVDLGHYTHHAASFHLYEPHWSTARDIVDGESTSRDDRTILPFGDKKSGTWQSAQDSAKRVWHVVRGVAAADTLTSPTEVRYANLLLDRKLKVGAQNLKKLGVNNEW